jgi:putative endonuclease
MQVLLSKREIGDKGESLAIKYLKNNGFSVIQKNFRTPAGEIDIIAKKGGVIHFFEVKTRYGLRYGHPFEAVTAQKKRRMKKVAEWFLLKAKLNLMPCLFGVIGIDNSKSPPSIECVTDAFE